MAGRSRVADELADLLHLNFDVINALKGKKVDPRLRHSEGLAFKLFGHAATALHLERSKTRPNIPQLGVEVNFIDWASIQVLARAATEVSLAFNYVYLEPARDRDDDEAEFRYLAWMLAGFSQRESFPAQTGEGKRQIVIDAKENARMRRRIGKTVRFQALSDGQKRMVLEGRNWHPGRTTSSMCEDVFGKTWGRPLYGFMSSHAHADALSSVQVLQTHNRAAQLASGPLLVVALAVAHMSAAYAAMWVASRKVYEEHPARDLNDSYLQFRDFDPAKLPPS